MKQIKEDKNNKEKPRLLKKYISQKILLTFFVLVLVVVANILLKKYGGGYFNDIAQRFSGNYLLAGLIFFTSEVSIGIFPVEFFMMIYQSKDWGEYVLIVLILGILSSLSGFIAFLAGKYFEDAKISRRIVTQKKFKEYSELFLKYGWVIIILAATTPLPFAMVSFIAGYSKFSPYTYLKIIVPVRIIRFFISACFIKYSINLF